MYTVCGMMKRMLAPDPHSEPYAYLPLSVSHTETRLQAQLHGTERRSSTHKRTPTRGDSHSYAEPAATPAGATGNAVAPACCNEAPSEACKSASVND